MVAGVHEKAGTAEAVEQFYFRSAEHYVELLGNYKGVLMTAGQFLSLFDAEAKGAGMAQGHAADPVPVDRAGTHRRGRLVTRAKPDRFQTAPITPPVVVSALTL